MSRGRALEISDALVAGGVTHSIVAGVTDKFVPRERYTVNVTPMLVYNPTDITALQRLADSLSCDIAYINGSFTFTERK